MKIKRVEQRKFNHGDCGVACAAMVAGKSYEAVERVFNEKKLINKIGDYYTYHKDIIGVLEHFHVKADRRIFKTWCNVETPAIVKINVRKGNFWHWVVLDEQNSEKVMFDPKPGQADLIKSFRGKIGAGQYLKIIRDS